MILTIGVGKRICGKNRIWDIPPEIKPANVPKPTAISKGVLAIRKLSLGLVGLLINISFITIPQAREIAIQGNRVTSGNSLNSPISVRKNCPMFQPIKADDKPAKM
jgi:hypothetical protein